MRNTLTYLLALGAVSSVSAEIKIEPTLHFTAVGGTTSADSISELAAHAHDPLDEVGIQALEMGMNLHLDEWLKGFVNVTAFTDSAGDLDAEWEEGFLKLVDLPFDLEVRGGRFLNRFGSQNNRHLHSWNFVDANLSTSTFLGEEGLFTEGGELSWSKEFDQGFFVLNGSFGNAVVHDHHGEEEDHHGEEENHDGDEIEEEHGHEEGAENAYFNDTFWTVNALVGFNQNDFNQHRFGLNLAQGDNAYDGGESEVFSADYAFAWRENGLEPGGQSFSAGAEFFHRNVVYEVGEDASHIGWMLFAAYELNKDWRFDFRYDRINEVEAGLHEDEYEFAIHGRERYSLAATRALQISDESLARVRLQYNHDKLEEGSEDSIWLQFSYDFGRGEVR
ncbi:MAG: hypothetical protein ACON4K_09840 [Akkermansiaceae bacterium]